MPFVDSSAAAGAATRMQALGLLTCAEGISPEVQPFRVEGDRCLGQGYHYARPLDPDSIARC